MRAALRRPRGRRPSAPALAALAVVALTAAACGRSPAIGTSESELSFGSVKVGQTLSQIYSYGGGISRSVTAVSVCAPEWSRTFNYEVCDGTGCTYTENVALPKQVYARFLQGEFVTATLDIVYTYRPGNRGADVCTSTITTSTGTATVPLDGTGVAPELTLVSSPQPFAARRINTTSVAMNFSIRNDGDAGQNLTVTAIGTLANPNDWVINFNSATALAPGELRTGTVAFSPKAAGARDTQLRIVTNDPVDADEVFDLKGTGLFASATAPNAVAFNATVVGQASTTTVTVTNNGTADTKLSATTLAGATAGDFSVTAPALPVTIAAGGGTVNLTVACRPSGIGARSATLTIDTDADITPQDPAVTLNCTGIKPEITVMPAPPSAVGFGNVYPGVAATQDVVVTNSSLPATGSALTVGAPVLGGANAADFSIMPAAGFTLNPGQSRTLTVTFVPGAFGARAGTLTINSDDQETPSIALSLTGTGFGPELTLTTAATLDFGDVRVGSASPAQTATVRNDGNGNLGITSVSLVGGDAARFAITSGPNAATVMPGATLSWNVVCNPAAVGGIATTLRIVSSDPSEPSTDVTLRCTGTQGSLEVSSPALPVAFPATDVGAMSAPIQITVRNSGTANVTIPNQPVVNGNGFALTTGFAVMTIAPGGTATFAVRFTPTVDGAVNGAAVVAYDTQVLTVPLTGTGRAALVSVDPVMQAFGNIVVGASATRPVSVRNGGSGTLNVVAANLTGDAAFSRSGNYPTAVTGGTVHTINVTCAPLTTGAKAATLAIDTDADNAPADVDVALTCTGVKPDIMLSDMTIAWGDVAPGTPTQRMLTITNMAGATVSNLSVQAPVLAGANVADFSVSPAGAFSLAPGAQRVLTLTFTPAALGNRAATLRITSDDQETPTIDVPLTGTGRDRELTIVAPVGAVGFGNVKVGTSATPAAITLRNDGNADLSISGVTATGADAAQFVIDGPATPATIAPATTTMWTVACRPTSTGAKTATLEIRSDDADEGLRSFSMTCTGTQSNLVMTTPAATPVTFASTRVGEASPLVTVIVENSGTAPLDVVGPPLVTPAVFTVVDTFMRGENGFTLQPGQSDRVTLRFRPTAEGMVPGMLTINWDATSLAIPLAGPGTLAVAGVTPSAPEGSSVDLGAVCVGQPRTQHFTIDSLGSGAFRIESITVTGDGFTLVAGAPLPLTLGPGLSYGFDVVAAPPAVAPITGTLTVTTDVPGMAVRTVPLRAAGLQSGVGVAPTGGVDFGTVDPDVISAESAVTLTNCNVGPLSITGAALQGADRVEFIISGGTLPTVNMPLVLATSQSAQWLLAFQPLDPGPASARFHLTHDGPGGGTDVELTGRGTGGPDIDAGVDAGLDAGPDAGGNPIDDDGKTSYYACAAAGASGLTTLLLVLGATLLVTVRRRRRAGA